MVSTPLPGSRSDPQDHFGPPKRYPGGCRARGRRAHPLSGHGGVGSPPRLEPLSQDQRGLVKEAVDHEESVVYATTKGQVPVPQLPPVVHAHALAVELRRIPGAVPGGPVERPCYERPPPPPTAVERKGQYPTAPRGAAPPVELRARRPPAAVRTYPCHRGARARARAWFGKPPRAMRPGR